MPREDAAMSSTRDEQVAFVGALRKLDQHWAESFDDGDFFDLHYSSLFTEMWLRDGRPVPRTEAYGFMQSLSPQTAMKYLNRALQEGYLLEVENPDDRRSRLIAMSPKLKARLDALIDYALAEFRKAL